MDRGTGNFPAYRVTVEDDEAALISAAITDAVRYVEEELAPERVKATEYYHGRPLGNEVEGRSQAVMTEVRDGILGVLPSLLRVIHGPEHTVEYVPKTGEAVPMAEQATDYVRYVFEEDNNGFLVTHAVLKDGLLKKLGILKWGMDEAERREVTKYEYLTREDLLLLAEEPNTTIIASEPAGEGRWHIEVARTVPDGRIWIQPIPPDDFFWNREARSLADAVLVGHRERLTRRELLAMGVTEQQIDDFGGRNADGPQTLEELARRESGGGGFDPDPNLGEANERFVYCEVYMHTDKGLRRICTLGDQFHPIKNVPVASIPFAVFSPDPEPHAMLGGSWYDLLKDLQRINSQLLRGFLDSLAVSLFPRPIYVDGQASVADIMNNAIGAPVRERLPNMVRWDNTPFAGDKVLPALSMMREVVERRIGQKDGAMSLDMDALQSTGKEAVNAAIVAAQSQAELLARLYAEQVLKPMFRGLLPLVAHPKAQPRVVRLRGKYVPMSPATWDTSMDVSVNVALGTMNVDQKIATLTEVITDQAAILEQYGPQNPVVTLAMLRDAKAKRLMLAGIKDVDTYYLPVDPNWQPPPPPPPEPTPDELWIQAEKEMAFQKSMKELAIKQDELALQARQLEIDNQLRQKEIDIKENEHMHGLRESAEVSRYKADLEAEVKMRQIEAEQAVEAEKLALERDKLALEMRKLEVDMAIAQLQAATQKETAETSAKAVRETPKEKPEPKEKAEKPEPVVINVMPAAAPNVTVEAPEPRKRKGKLTGPDGKTYTMESDG